MPKYNARMSETVFYEVDVEAESEEQAREKIESMAIGELNDVDIVFLPNVVDSDGFKIASITKLICKINTKKAIKTIRRQQTSTSPML